MSEHLKAKLDKMTLADAEGYSRAMVQARFITNYERQQYLASRDSAYGADTKGGYVSKWS